jgi:CTP:molybdopterin cytidylyltransferase MocA
VIGAVVLAAGEGRRLGGRGKALLDVGGITFLERVIRTSREGGCDPVWVVVRPGHRETREMVVSLGARPVMNQDPDRGMFSSVVEGLGAALGEEPAVEGFVVFPVDHPRVRAATVKELIRSLVWKKEGTFVQPVHRNRSGHPIVIDPDGAHALCRLDPATVFRSALREAGLRPYPVKVADPHIRENLNTPSDLE